MLNPIQVHNVRCTSLTCVAGLFSRCIPLSLPGMRIRGVEGHALNTICNPRVVRSGPENPICLNPSSKCEAHSREGDEKTTIDLESLTVLLHEYVQRVIKKSYPISYRIVRHPMDPHTHAYSAEIQSCSSYPNL